MRLDGDRVPREDGLSISVNLAKEHFTHDSPILGAIVNALLDTVPNHLIFVS